MALNINYAEVERLAGEVAKLARESKTEAIRKALKDRASRLRMVRGGLTRDQRIDNLLARFRSEFPSGDFGRTMTKAEKEEILGFGPDGIK
ncbi:MAG: type II toxin-antitoxin system VapB family antitoxin [Acidobacteria bacterium]|nr:type II toxin-antitoxin system VapB family antitoxin [Acidobacteriota bacterium]